METKMTLKNSRVDVADVLRGFAVMGIIVLHSIEHYNFYAFPEVSSEWMKFTDKVIWDSMFFTFGGKAYAIFALLFGFSFFVQDNRQTQLGKDFRGRFAWRLVLLFVLGNINAMFFTAEILVLYSILGFVLIAVCRLSAKVILSIAVIFMLQPLAWWEMFSALLNPAYIPSEGVSSGYFMKVYEAQSGTSFLETVKMNLWEGQLASLTWAWEYGRIFQTASLFMLGMLVGRAGLFVYSEKHMKFWFIALIISLITFFPLHGLTGILPDFIKNTGISTPLLLIIRSLSNLAFMIAMVGGIILLFYSSRMKSLFMKLTPYGRMSLTDYMTQSIIGSLLFYGWGFGLYRYLGITWSFCVGLILFLLQYSFAVWWMKNHKQGPLEWIWKKATWITFRA